MRTHMRNCPPCERHDALVRRSLFLVKNLPTIEPSPEFRARLDARLRDEALRPWIAAPARRLTFSHVLTLTAAAVVLAIVVAEVRRRPAEPILMPPVVASAPAVETSPLASPALVATVPTGMSVWPAIMAASQMPVHYVATEMADER